MDRTQVKKVRRAGNDGPNLEAKTDPTSTTPTSGGVVSGTGPGYMGGPLILFVIALTYYLNMTCTKEKCALFQLPYCDGKWQTFFSLEVAGITLAFHALIFILALVPVGSIVQGPPMKNGQRLEYRCNGWLTLIVLTVLFGYAVQRGYSMDYIEKHYLQFVTASLIYAFLLTLIVLFRGWNSPPGVRCPGSDGTFLNDICMGRELNPRCGGVDIKQVVVRSGTIGWVVVDGMYLAAQFQEDGRFNPSLALVVLFQTLYIMLMIRNEQFMYSASDFATEGLGFMVSWFSISLIPFTFSIQTRFLYHYPQHGITNLYALAAVFILNFVGLAFFICANNQKNEFRKDPKNPKLSHLSSIPTATGKRLLSSGWWGIVRRPNYLGDLMIAFAFSLPCGFIHALPYFYPAYLLPLLVARAISDEKSCHQRYGDAWIKYTEAVPYRLIPYVF